MRQNRAARFNRNMMVMMIFIAIVVLGCVYTFLYLSLPKEQPQNNDSTDEYVDQTTLVVDSIGV
ncbi:MAG: hypothetical protein II806_03040 [Bacteroidaceae bacterium]|jgi:heme/copper-type cytochrome/quinol oxidase subunit 2|nr:hypothetical protein [Bacteroidaceae bacterium]MBP5522842.1 hypothetical protein [Bacteroidaceae bacterium]MBQ4380236.1 hypothetical protein [Bacteroidaceae bacterium]